MLIDAFTEREMIEVEVGGNEVLLGMGFLKHFELSQRDRALTLRAPANP